MLYTKLALRAYYDRISFSLKTKLCVRLKYLMTYMQLDNHGQRTTKDFSINTPTAYIICSIYSIPVFPYFGSRIHLWHLISRKIHTTFISIFLIWFFKLWTSKISFHFIDTLSFFFSRKLKCTKLTYVINTLLSCCPINSTEIVVDESSSLTDLSPCTKRASKTKNKIMKAIYWENDIPKMLKRIIFAYHNLHIMIIIFI